MKVAKYVINRLAEEGIKTAFLIQGGAMNALLFEIADHPEMDYVAGGQEQGSGFSAEGYAKTLDDVTPGFALATSGPGAQNLITAIANCFYDSVPVIFITGQVGTKFQRPNKLIRQIGFQETDIVSMVTPITKHAVQVHSPMEIAYELEHAIWCCKEGRPGPVLIDIPTDVQSAEMDIGNLVHSWAPPRHLYPMSGAKIDSFLDDLETAKRPVILIGGGVRGARATETMNAMAAALRIPLFPTWNALDTVASDHPWYGGRIGTYGGPGRNFAVQNCDLLLAIGCRLSGRITGGQPQTFARAAKRYVVDIDDGLLDPRTQQQPFHINIHADATDFMRDLEAAHRRRELASDMSAQFVMRGEWMRDVDGWRKTYDPVAGLPSEHPYRFIRRLSDAVPSNAVIVTDCGGNVVMMNQAFKTKTGQRYFSNNGNSPMGFSLAAAIGAWHADKSRPVICVIGDGGFFMNVQELAVLKETQANVKVFVINNHGYGITRAFQETHNAGRAEASTPESGLWLPEINEIAAAYNLTSYLIGLIGNIHSPLDMVDRLMRLVGPLIIDVDIGDFHEYLPRISGWDTPIEDASPLLPRDEFRNQMIIEPMPGWESRK